jgi:hypothetical protein
MTTLLLDDVAVRVENDARVKCVSVSVAQSLAEAAVLARRTLRRLAVDRNGDA